MAEYDLTAQITAVLKEYTGEIMDGIDEAVKECGKGLRKDIAAKSNKRTGRYRKGWRCDIKSRGRGDSTAKVYNKTDYQLTHLLENGHKKGRGRAAARPFPHIAPSEEKWNRIFEEKSVEVCKGK